jgi:hypothetical protein
MNNILISQNLYIILISILNLSYLFRLWKHISIRTSWIIAPIIIFPFLTSVYDNTFIYFLLNPDFQGFSLESLKEMFLAWFGGNPESMFLIGIIFLCEKISLTTLSPSVLLELWLISIGLCTFILKIIGISNGATLIMGILLPLLIHTYKRKEQFFNLFDLRNNYIDKPFLNKRDLIRVLSGSIFILLILISNRTEIQFSIINLTHVARIFIFMGVFLGLLIFFKSFNQKIITTYLPVILLFLFFSLANIFNTDAFNETSTYRLNGIASIAFLPLVEYMYVLIYSFQNKIQTSIVSSKQRSLLIFSKLMIGFLTFCYASYVLTSN